MKLIYVAIDGMGDLPIESLDNKTPLEAAETPSMDNLAREGKTGLMYSLRKGVAPESDVAVISLLGYDPFKYSTGRGVIEVVGSGLSMKDGDLALRCNFATLGQGQNIVDRRVGRTLGHRAVLLIKSLKKPLSSNITNSDPAYTVVNGIGIAQANVDMVLKTCEPLDDTQEAQASAVLVNEFIEKAHDLWGKSIINMQRVAKGKLEANVVLTRDAGHLFPKFFNIEERYKVNFAVLADMHAERGIAHLAGMKSTLLPPPSGNLEKDCKIRVKVLLDALPKHDCFYIHLKGPDEPGHDGNFKLKTHIISAIDKFFFGELMKEIALRDHLICITSDHATPCALKMHSDTPVPLLISGDKVSGDKAVYFSERECANGSLGTMDRGCELMPKLMKLLKDNNK